MRPIVVAALLLNLISFQVICNELSSKHIVGMSLNIYGWKTMPHSTSDYVNLVKKHEVSVLLIQEGVNDWKIKTKMPTDYSRAEILRKALGKCWQRSWQIFVNTCKGISIVDSTRFDLSDGPNAVRTGEIVQTRSALGDIHFVNVHWEHESATVRRLNAIETLEAINSLEGKVILAGDFNLSCEDVTGLFAHNKNLSLSTDGGIDCVFSKGYTVGGAVVDAAPSDHPAILMIIN